MRWGILGPLLIADDAGRVIPIPAKRLRVLLAALLVRANQVVSLDELIELVWDGTPPGGADRTLRVYVVRLRRALGPGLASRIVTRAPGYLCEAAESELDVLRFEALCRLGGSAVRGAAWSRGSELLSRALELWRGEPLLDVPSDRLREQSVHRFGQLRLQALEDRAEAELRLGRAEQLVPQLRDLIASHPLREHLRAQLMRALDRTGQRAEALSAYQDARRALVDQLGIEPGAELRLVHRRILAGEPEPIVIPAVATTSASVVPRQLPAAVRHFVGRAGELKALSELAEPSDRVEPHADAGVVATVCGTAGVGKTALAVHFAHQHADRFPDGQLYADLRGFDPAGAPVDASGALRRFLDALAVPSGRIPSDPDAQLALYRSLLADKRMLVVLDNARDESQVRPLLPGSAGCLTVVTSRNQLAGLIALDGAIPFTLDLLSPDEARELLTRRLGRERVTHEERAATRLIDLCARLPLALNIAAARAALHADRSLDVLSEGLRDAHRRLDLLSAGGSSANMRAVFSYSYRTLSPGAARLFRLIGLHPGPHINAAAAASLAAIEPRQVRYLLEELTDAHLLAEPVPDRYSLHDLLRTYAAELVLAEDGDGARDAATHRMFDHYLQTGYAADRVLSPSRPPIAVAPSQPGVTPEILVDLERIRQWFRDEHAVLLALIEQAARGGYDVYAWQLPWTIADHFQRQGHWQDQIESHRIALAAAERLDDAAAQAYANRVLGRAYTRLGSYEEADRYLLRALELHEEAGDEIGQAATHRGLAWVYERQDRIDPAIDHALRAVELFRSADDRGGEATALNAAAWLYTRRGDYEQAVATCREALELHRHHAPGDSDVEANTWVSLGYAYHHQGKHAEAVACYRRALPLLQEHGMRYFEADALSHLGDAHRASGDHPAARAAWTRALDIFTDLDHPDAEAVRTKLHGL